MSPDPIRLLLVDDHEVVLHGLRHFFETQPDLQVVATASSFEAALAAAESCAPDVALLDLRLGDDDGISLCREIRTRCPNVACLMLSSYGAEDVMIEAVLGGAGGYVLKDAPLREVAEAIRVVARGGSTMDPRLIARAVNRLRPDPVRNKLAELTSQEQRILDLVAEGLTNREVAQQMHLAEQTVKNYVSNILSKLGLKRRTQAVRFAAEGGRGMNAVKVD